MGPKTAIVAGGGVLPTLLGQRLEADGTEFLLAEMEGFAAENPNGWPLEPLIVERLALFLKRLKALQVTRVVFAGALARPALDPARIDPETVPLLARLVPALQSGDDALLREVVAVFEEAGFDVVGVDAICPDLVPAAGVLGAVQPTDHDKGDAARGVEILATLSPLDIGQGCVVAQGLCLAIETLPGTDAMLDWVADVAITRRPQAGGGRGVFYKAPKQGQDLRIDMPAIGPDTVARVARAGLAGIAFQAGGILLLDREATLTAADAAGLFLWARPA